MGQAKQRKALMGEDYGKKPNPWETQNPWKNQSIQGLIPLQYKIVRTHPMCESVPAECLYILCSDVYTSSHTLSKDVRRVFSDSPLFSDNPSEIPNDCSFLRVSMVGDDFGIGGFAFVSDTFSEVRSLITRTPPLAVLSFIESQEFTTFGTVLTIMQENLGRVRR